MIDEVVPLRTSVVQHPPVVESAGYLRAKRAFDVVVSSVVLVASAPVVALAAVAIRIETPGNPLFRQVRMGQHGRPFELVKLRGMHVDAPERWPHLYDHSGAADAAAYFFHTPHDPRVTRVGRVLRRFSIDELPNFWNVLRGDMSIVGPRPEIPEMAPAYGPHLERLLSVKPGITSPSKARGRDQLSFRETLALDLQYLESRSLRGDVKVVVETARSVILGHGVH